MDKRLSIFIKL